MNIILYMNYVRIIASVNNVFFHTSLLNTSVGIFKYRPIILDTLLTTDY